MTFPEALRAVSLLRSWAVMHCMVLRLTKVLAGQAPQALPSGEAIGVVSLQTMAFLTAV